MRILASTGDYVSDIFGIPVTRNRSAGAREVFDSFEFCDMSTPGIQEVFDAECADLGDWEYVILERFAERSQLVRLRRWRAGSVMSVAMGGNGFIGQVDRKWHALKGNIHWCSVIPLKIPVGLVPYLQMLPSLCVYDVLSVRWKPGVLCWIKHPNDIVLLLPEAHKIAGCLTEVSALADETVAVRFGIGINLIAAPEITEPGHLPAVCCAPYFKDDADSYRPVLFELSRRMFATVKSFEKDLHVDSIRNRFEEMLFDI